MGKKLQTHTAFGTTLDLGPYTTLELPQPQRPQLVGVISHHGSSDSGHYTAITKKEENWTLFDDNSTIHMPKQQVLQTQAYILLYRISDSRVEPDRTKGPSPSKRDHIASPRPPYCPKKILETNGRILHGPEHKHRILDT